MSRQLHAESTMRTLHALLRSSRHALARLADEGASESGVTLIEVIASALIVALVAVGTLTGFGGAGRAVADERQRGQATLLAAQDEERLRAMNVTELGNLGTATRAVTETGAPYSEGSSSGTKFTIESKAQFVTAGKEPKEEAFTCETEGAANYIQTTSKVRWAALGSGEHEREPVSQSSLVPVPASDSLLVNVRNQANEPVEGATVKVTGKTSGATHEQLTPASGCVIFGAMSDSEVLIVASKAGWINENLETESSQEAKLSTTSLVSKTFTIASPGGIKAEFESNGATSGIQGDEVHVAHTGTPEKVVGTAGKYESSITASPLYPFQTATKPPGESPYTVYAGECSSSDPAKVNTALKDPASQVQPGVTKGVKVELPQIKAEIWEGSSSTNKGSLDSNAEVKLTDACGTARTMKTSVGAPEHPYQPYGKTKFCVTQEVKGTRYKYSTEFTVTEKAGYTLPSPIYLSSSTYKSSSGC
jgi:type II secretory pathway pseudopilin PulG